MKTINFHPNVVAQLKQLRLYTKFIKNVRAYRKCNPSVNSPDLSTDSTLSVLWAAFVWNNTPEGHDFWENVVITSGHCIPTNFKTETP
jgi:hypothetical protein